MTRSIRWRVQLWYGLILAAAVGGFGVFLYLEVQRARRHEIDADLIAAAGAIEASLRGVPRHELDGGSFRPPPLEGWPPPPGPPPAGRPEGGPPPRRPFPNLAPAGWPPDAPDRYFAVWRADGGLLQGVGRHEPIAPPAFDRWPVLSNHGTFREAVLLGPRNSVVLVGRSTEKLRAELRAFAGLLALAGGAVLVIGLAGGWVISSRIVRPIARISEAAARVSASNLSERIATDGVASELEGLAGVLNATFDRLEAAFGRQAQFTADASHELRTPLAIVKSHAELALARPRSADEYRHTLQVCRTATDRMAALVDKLLTLARADAGRLDLRREPVQFDRVITEALMQFGPLIEAAKLKIGSQLSTVCVAGDAGALAQVVGNLVSNAIQYNRPGGSIDVRLTTDRNAATLAVADTGPGIPESDRPHIFERFYRVDKARSRASGGTGLGLAICQSIIAAHGGTIDFDSRLNEGTTFRVVLPLPTVQLRT